MPDLLLELHSDEIPARMQSGAASDLRRMLKAALDDQVSSDGEVIVHVTPNRLCAVARDLPETTAGAVEERRGPREGAPQNAISGFARSAGVEVDDLEIRSGGSGTYYFAVRSRPGRAIAEVVGEIVPDIIRTFPWPKSMRWGSGDLKWVRPLNSVLCILHDASTARTVEFEIGELRPVNTTIGHRFMAPRRFEVGSFEEYRTRLREAFVVLDAGERLELLRSQVHELADGAGLSVVEDEALLEENAGLVEWPVALLGEIDRRHRELPSEILVAAIRTHLKFLSLCEPGTDRISHFVAVANKAAKDGNRTILEGNRRVVDARLGDAEFAWENDLRRFRAKGAVADLRAELGRMAYHSELGSLGQRVDRVRELAVLLAGRVGADRDMTADTAEFIKLDLLSNTVGEFPELQGVIGRRLASEIGLSPTVGLACEQHYMPAGPDDRVPSDPVVVALAVSERLDHLVGFFGIGLAPTGSKDPYSLRRAALGIIRLVLENRLRLRLASILAESAGLLGNQGLRGFTGTSNRPEEAVPDAMRFIHERLLNHLVADGLRQDVVLACIAAPEADDLHLVELKSRALQAFLEVPGNERLVQGYRRANNILRGLKEGADGAAAKCDRKLFTCDEEKELHGKLQVAAEDISGRLAEGDPAAAIAAMTGLVDPINNFFENVRVNSEDEHLRSNRLSLVSSVRGTISEYAELSLVEI